MTITPEMIEQRLQVLEAQERKLLADLNAVSGAKQECLKWLEVLEKPAEPVPQDEV